MENNERAIIEELSGSNRELRRLYKRHRELDQKLQDLQNLGYQTIKEELETKKLKNLKLRGRDRMMAILRSNQSSYSETQAA